jgi:GAF domain-containing protein
MSHKAAGRIDQDTVRRLIDQTLTQTVERLGAYGGGLALVDEDGEVLTTHVGVGLPPEFARPLHRKRLTTPIADPAVEAVRERRLVWVASGEELILRFPQPARIMPHQAMAAAPVATDGTVWGVLMLIWPASRHSPLSAAELAAIDEATARLAELLQDAAEAGLRLPPPARPRSLPLPRRATASPAEAQAAVDYVTRLPEGGCALALDGRIAFVDPDAADLLGGRVADLLGVKLWEALPWLRDPQCEQAHRQAVLRQRAISFTAVRPPDRHLLFQLYPDPTGVSVRVSAITAEHVSRERNASTPPVARRPQAAPGPMTLETMYDLIHLAGALTQAKDVPEVVDLVSDHFLLAFGAQACALLTTESGRLRILSDHGFNPEVAHIFDHMPLTADIPGALALTAGVPLFFADDDELARMYPALGEFDSGVAAWAYLPLIVSGRPVGACVLGYDRPHHFTDEERITLTSFSALIAQALDRARLYDAKSRLVQSLQAGLLPPRLPRVPGVELTARYIAAGHGIDIGGDFYDVIPLGPREVVAVIGDVQGHDATAAALMGHLRTAVHAYALTGISPSDVLARTNRLITDLDPHLLASCLYAHLDLAGRRVRLATAGHHPPLLRHAGLPAEILQIPPGPLLGVAASGTYPTIEAGFAPGTILAMYTDGLVETPCDDPDSTLNFLAALLDHADRRLDEVADALVRRARPFGEPTDDTTVLLLRTTPETAPR